MQNFKSEMEYVAVKPEMNIEEVLWDFAEYKFDEDEQDSGFNSHVKDEEDPLFQTLEMKIDNPYMKGEVLNNTDEVSVKLETLLSEEFEIKSESDEKSIAWVKQNVEIEHSYSHRELIDPLSNTIASNSDAEVEPYVVANNVCVKKKSFKCGVCEFRSNRKLNIQRHMQKHIKEPPFVCNTCKYICESKLRLDTHVNTYTGDEPFKCTVCGNKFGRKDHLSNCDVCGYKIQYKTTLQNAGSKRTQCIICNDKYLLNSNFKEHQLPHFKIIKPKGPKEFKCNVCDFKSPLKNALQKHMLIHVSVEFFKCGECDFKTDKRLLLHAHAKIHTEAESFKCDISNFGTVSEKPHVESRRSNKLFKCFTCNEKFISSSLLEKHVTTHLRSKVKKEDNIIKYFCCNVCEFKSTQNSALEIHMFTHTGEKPFQCKMCDYKCVRENYLVKHMTLHNGRKNYKCDVCGYKCVGTSTWQNHVMTHW